MESALCWIDASRLCRKYCWWQGKLHYGRDETPQKNICQPSQPMRKKPVCILTRWNQQNVCQYEHYFVRAVSLPKPYPAALQPGFSYSFERRNFSPRVWKVYAIVVERPAEALGNSQAIPSSFKMLQFDALNLLRRTAFALTWTSG